jgi:hypothetical protein
MVALKCVLMLVGAGVFGSTGALVVYDIYVSTQLRRLLRGKNGKAGSFFQRGVKRRSLKTLRATNLRNEIPLVRAKACAAAHR